MVKTVKVDGEDQHFLTAYFVQPTGADANANTVNTAQAEFISGVTRASSLYGSDGSKARRVIERVYVYGRGIGARVPYSAIDGDIRTSTEADLKTPRLIAEYMSGGPVKPVNQKPLTSAQDKQQHQLVTVFEDLPTNDLERPIVRRAYDALAKALMERREQLDRGRSKRVDQDGRAASPTQDAKVKSKNLHTKRGTDRSQFGHTTSAHQSTRMLTKASLSS